MLLLMRYLVVASLVIIGSVVVRNVTDAIRGLTIGQTVSFSSRWLAPPASAASRTEIVRSAS